MEIDRRRGGLSQIVGWAKEARFVQQRNVGDFRYAKGLGECYNHNKELEGIVLLLAKATMLSTCWKCGVGFFVQGSQVYLKSMIWLEPS